MTYVFKLLKDAFKVKQVRSKILFTIFIILVFRIGTTITVPGVNAKILNNLQDVSFLNMLSLVSGNAMRNFSVFALGVSPYITASIVVQLLQMDLLPKFVEWGKQGEVGRRKLNQATRYISLVLAFVQSIGITATFHTLSQAKLVATPNTKTYLLIGAILTTGSMIVTWLGEQITDKGYGNGVSMIIFAGIVSSIPEMIKEIYENAFVNVRSGQMTNSLILLGFNSCCLGYCLLYNLCRASTIQDSNPIYKDCSRSSIKFLPSFESEPSRSYSCHLR